MASPLHRPRTAWFLLAVVAVLVAAAPASASGGATKFIRSAVEHGDGTATFPLLRGTSQGRTVWFVVLDASTSNAADRYGANRSNKLANARGTAAVQNVRVSNGTIDFPASVDFTPRREVAPGAPGFPPAVAEPGAVGEAGYSPLVQLPDGTVLNAPQLANDTGRADKVVDLDNAGRTVTYRETDGFSPRLGVRYVSTDASDPAVAALENSTFARPLEHSPLRRGQG